MADSEARTGGESAGAGAPDETSSAEGRTSYARSAVREQTDRLKQRAREKGSEMKETAQRRAEELKHEAERRGDELTSRLGERASVFARALRRAGDELRSEGEPRIAEMTENAAEQVERMSGYLDGRQPNQMLGDLERMARQNPAFFIGGTFALGLLMGRVLRAGEPAAEVVFEPEGDWGVDGDGSSGGDGSPAGGDEETADFEADAVLERAQTERAMTPDLENISDQRPSTPPPGGARERFADETPARSAMPGHETIGGGVRTGSSGAAAIDAGSAGPRQGEHDARPMRRRDGGER